MNRRERRFQAEISYHLDRVTEDHIARGMDPAEARRQALLEFGGATQIREELRDVHRPRWLADLRQDLLYAARTLRRSPGFLASAVMTLALGIGANTAIFSLIDALVLRPMPGVRDAAAMVEIARQIPEHCQDCRVSYPLFEYFRDRLSSVSGAFAVMDVRHSVTVGGIDEDLNGDEVSGDFYAALGLAPAAGRLLGPADDAVPTPVAVISYDYWRRRFGLDPAAIGKTMTYATTTLTIVGVEPEGFAGIEPWRTREFATPLSMSDRLAGGDGSWKTRWDQNYLEMMARLNPGGSIGRANAEIASVFGVWRQEKAPGLPAFFRERFLRERAAALPGVAGLNGLRVDFLRPLAILMGIVGLVLLLACANLSGLLLARAAARQREISIRRALGAGRGRLTRQFLAEGLLLAACGAAAGFALAQWLVRALVMMMANGEAPLPLRVSPDWRIFAFTAAVSVFACMLSGLAPGLSAGKGNLNPALREVRVGGGPRRLGRGLVITQLAVSMTLLVGASLFIRTLVKLYHVDSGIHAGGVILFNVSGKHHFPEGRSAEIEAAILNRVKAIPGVVAASAANMLPLGNGLWTRQVQVEDHPFQPGEDDTAAVNAVAPDFFRVTGTPLLLGRDFRESDEAGGTAVAIVNQTFVRELLGTRPPIGHCIVSNDVTYRIVGVVKDAKYESLRKGVPRTLYIPWAQQGSKEWSNRSQPMGYSYMARVATGNPMRLAPLIEREIPHIDSALSVYGAETFQDHVDRSLLNERMMATLGAFFGLLALMVACLGIFGILAFQVSRRINEIGVRLALGATRDGIVLLVLREVTLLLVPGCAAGALAAAWLSRFAASFLFGVTPTDPAAFVLAASALAAATLAAGFLPAMRAARVDPMTALRCD